MMREGTRSGKAPSYTTTYKVFYILAWATSYFNLSRELYTGKSSTRLFLANCSITLSAPQRPSARKYSAIITLWFLRTMSVCRDPLICLYEFVKSNVKLTTFALANRLPLQVAESSF